uniref:Uncharacterized protein n=1 Tax=Tetranychus urticae TaxID=32264 RepID=T1L614_TETUR
MTLYVQRSSCPIDLHVPCILHTYEPSQCHQYKPVKTSFGISSRGYRLFRKSNSRSDAE